MKFRDMFRMSLSSLWKRKVRTFLTVLGVVVGSASIVVMISLGLGLSRASMAEIEKYGGITTVTVTEQDSYTVDSSITGAASKSQTAEHLDDALVENILQLDHVKDAYPVLDTDALAISGGFQANIQKVSFPLYTAIWCWVISIMIRPERAIGTTEHYRILI